VKINHFAFAGLEDKDAILGEDEALIGAGKFKHSPAVQPADKLHLLHAHVVHLDNDFERLGNGGLIGVDYEEPAVDELARVEVGAVDTDSLLCGGEGLEAHLQMVSRVRHKSKGLGCGALSFR
jgi:hypothetical protein